MRFIQFRALTKVQAILTQLIFEHSLRIRAKAETTSSTASEATISRAPSSAASVTEVAADSAQSESETIMNDDEGSASEGPTAAASSGSRESAKGTAEQVS